MKRRTPLRILASTIAALSTIPVVAGVELDDYEAPPDGGFNNLFFNNATGPHEINGLGPFVDFSDFEFVSASHQLFLVGTDYITFNVAPGEFVNYAEVWMKGYGAQSLFHIIGVDGGGNVLDVTLNSPASGPHLLYTTTGLGFSRIDEIRLSGLEGGFDDLKVNVVPEPTTLTILAITLVGVLRRRRR